MHQQLQKHVHHQFDYHLNKFFERIEFIFNASEIAIEPLIPNSTPLRYKIQINFMDRGAISILRNTKMLDFRSHPP